MLSPGPHRPLTPRVPLPTSPISSSMSSAPLFKEDKYSSTSEEESEVEAEVTFLHNRCCPSGTFANDQTERPTSTPMTSAIDDLTTYDDIKLFPELYDTSTIIERITGEADLIERQLRQPGMYPQLPNISPSTSAPKPTSVFEPSLTDKQSTESSPQSSLPCGQRTPTASTSSSDAPASHIPPQPFVHTQHTSPKPHKQQIQCAPVKTNTNQPTQPSISDEEQRVPKSADGSQVKHSKQQLRQQDECLCFYCNQASHLKRSCPEIPYCSKCRPRDTHQTNAPANHRGTGTHAKLENPETNNKGTMISFNFQAVTTGVFIVQITRL